MVPQNMKDGIPVKSGSVSHIRLFESPALAGGFFTTAPLGKPMSDSL